MESKSVLTRCGDDLFSIAVTTPADAQGLAVQLRQSGTWLEVVPGIDSVVVRFDLATIQHYLGVTCRPLYCTKVASKLARTFTDRHSLRDLCRELLGVDLSKQQQSSDWGAANLSDEQLRYAASDVLYLHRLKVILDDMLDREGRRDLAQACFDFLPSRAALDLAGWGEVDILAH